MLMPPSGQGVTLPGVVLGKWVTGGVLVIGFVLFRGGRHVYCARRCLHLTMLHLAYAASPTFVYHVVSLAQAFSCEMTLQAQPASVRAPFLFTAR